MALDSRGDRQTLLINIVAGLTRNPQQDVRTDRTNSSAPQGDRNTNHNQAHQHNPGRILTQPVVERDRLEALRASLRFRQYISLEPILV